MVLLICVGTPLLGAFLLPALGHWSEKARRWGSLLMVLTALVCAAIATVDLLHGQADAVRLQLPLGLSMGLRMDALAAFMALTACTVSAVIVVYSFGYMKTYTHLNEYYLMITFFIGAMLGLVMSTSLLQMYIFWEFSSFCCWRLIGFYRDDLSVKRADKAFMVTVLGALAMLVGFTGIYGATGTFDLDALQGSQIPGWSTGLILVGILSKSATFPLHNWLPDAGVAPSPVTSLLHAAVLVKIGVFAYARLFVLTFSIDPVITVIVPAIAAVSALVSAGCAMMATDIKRVVAYSTISQLAFILLGLSSGSRIGFAGGLLYILAHSMAKAGLFLCCGIVEHNLHTKDMTKMGGLARTMPKTAVAFAFCALSVMGIPPFSGYFAKYLVISGEVDAGHPVIAAVFILGAVMTIMYLVRLFAKVFLGPCRNPESREGNGQMVGSVLTLAVLSLLLGLLIFLPSGLITLAMEAM
ncbi:MAG: NADH-quinone oxidoreductase subunit L [Oscillospiraceae bacterium]|nr:NADH-quinone oxidoreductase subunit L [Oscillospiraceae bacterium]